MYNPCFIHTLILLHYVHFLWTTLNILLIINQNICDIINKKPHNQDKFEIFFLVCPQIEKKNWDVTHITKLDGSK